MTLTPSKSNKGWHKQWFYVKNDAAAPLPAFFGHLIKEAPPVWGWGPPEKEKKRLRDLLDAIALLKSNDLRGVGVIGAYRVRRVALLMACALSLYEMVPSAQLDGTVLALGELHDEVTQRIKEAMEESDVGFPILGHPSMWPDMGFIDMASSFWFSYLADPLTLLFNSESWGLQVSFGFWTSIASLPEHMTVRVTNRATDNKKKKKKDEE
jgi:hypothetical protein